MKVQTRPIATGVRQRLIEAAGEVFGEQGYHGATAREITRRAGANLAAINYYFRDKEELYWEVLRHALHSSMKNDKAVAEEASPEKQLGMFITEFLSHLLDPKRPDWHGKLISREMSSPTRMLDILVETSIRPKGQFLRKILRRLCHNKLSEEKETLLCASVLGQCLYYRQNGPVLERLYPDFLEGKNKIDCLARHITAFSLAGIKEIDRANGEIPKAHE